MIKLAGTLGLAVLCGAGAVAAQDDGSAPSSENVVTHALRSGWYTVPMLSVMDADKDRLIDGGTGYTLALGYRWDFASVELNGEYFALDQQDNGADQTRLRGGSVNALLHPFESLRIVTNVYGLVGFGAHGRENHPRFAAEDKTFYIDAGLGLMAPFELFGADFALRLEGKYRLDTQQPPFEENTPREFEDWVYSVGLYLPLSREPQPVEKVRPAPVAVVPVAPPADSDGDGVLDAGDQCPGTPAGTAVSEVGCVPEPTLVLRGVNFETSSDALTAEAQTILDGVAKTLLATPGKSHEVGGHTDSVGDEAYNQNLSQRRAESVRAYLIGRGVSAETLTAAGYGESQPLDSNDTADGRAQNRRVELKVVDAAAATTTAVTTGSAPEEPASETAETP